MAGMFPSPFRPPASGTGQEDPNRVIRRWQPGQPTPTSVRVAFGLFVAACGLLLFTGLLYLTAQWDAPAANEEQAQQMAFVLRNTRILGAVNVIASLLLAWFSLGVLRGKRNHRRYALWVSMLAIFFLLAGWLLQFTGFGQAIVALLLAIANLLAFRVSVDTYYDNHTATPTVAPGERHGERHGEHHGETHA